MLTCRRAVEGEVVSQIERGLLVLVGITSDDTLEDLEYIASKILLMKLFTDDAQKMWANSVTQSGYEILSVSQVSEQLAMICH